MYLPGSIVICGGTKSVSKLNHFNVSIVKSALRVVAGLALMYGAIFSAGGLLIAAEMLGILEEFVDKREEI